MPDGGGGGGGGEMNFTGFTLMGIFFAEARVVELSK